MKHNIRCNSCGHFVSEMDLYTGEAEKVVVADTEEIHCRTCKEKESTSG